MIARRDFLILAASCAAEAALAQSPDPLARRFGGPFTLVSHTGESVTEKTFAGKFMLVYFGFTHCADTCPGDLQTVTAALDMLSAAEIGEVRPLFITVDPEYDTPAAMAEYLKAFHGSITGLTGTEARIAAAAKAYRVHRRLLQTAPEKKSGRLIHLAHGSARKPGAPYRGGGWTIDHGSLIYLMGREGEFITLFTTGADAGKIAARLKRLGKSG